MTKHNAIFFSLPVWYPLLLFVIINLIFIFQIFCSCYSSLFLSRLIFILFFLSYLNISNSLFWMFYCLSFLIISWFYILFFLLYFLSSNFVSYGKPSSFIRPVPLDKYTLLYRPPPKLCAEFEVELCTIPSNSDAYHPSVLPCGYLLLLFKGNTCMISEGNNVFQSLKLGSVSFISANCDITVLAGKDGAVFYRAHVNLGDGHMCPHGY